MGHGRKTFFETLEGTQKDLQEYLVPYDTQQLHQGLDWKGRAPAQALWVGLPKDSQVRAKKTAIPTIP